MLRLDEEDHIYKNMVNWYKELRHYCPHIPVICVANKVDADPNMAKKKFNFATENKLPFYFVSAADGTNIVKVFNEVVKLAIKCKEEPEDEVMSEIMRLLQEEDEVGGPSACSTRASTPA